MIDWLLPRLGAILFGLIVWPVVGAALVWVAGVVLVVREGVRGAIASDRSLWYHAGRASVYARIAIRHPNAAAAAVAAAPVAKAVTDSISAAIGDADIRSNQNPPPEVPPIQADNLRMPTAYPFKRVRTLPWPPFLGHRVPLGSDRS